MKNSNLVGIKAENVGIGVCVAHPNYYSKKGIPPKDNYSSLGYNWSWDGFLFGSIISQLQAEIVNFEIYDLQQKVYCDVDTTSLSDLAWKLITIEQFLKINGYRITPYFQLRFYGPYEIVLISDMKMKDKIDAQSGLF